MKLKRSKREIKEKADMGKINLQNNDINRRIDKNELKKILEKLEENKIDKSEYDRIYNKLKKINKILNIYNEEHLKIELDKPQELNMNEVNFYLFNHKDDKNKRKILIDFLKKVVGNKNQFDQTMEINIKEIKKELK